MSTAVDNADRRLPARNEGATNQPHDHIRSRELTLKSLNEFRYRGIRPCRQPLPSSLASLNGKITGYEFRIVAKQLRQFSRHINRGLAVRTSKSARRPAASYRVRLPKFSEILVRCEIGWNQHIGAFARRHNHAVLFVQVVNIPANIRCTFERKLRSHLQRIENSHPWIVRKPQPCRP